MNHLTLQFWDCVGDVMVTYFNFLLNVPLELLNLLGKSLLAPCQLRDQGIFLLHLATVFT